VSKLQSLLFDIRARLIFWLAGDMQVLVNITMRKGCWFVSENSVCAKNVVFTEGRWMFETPEQEKQFRERFPDNHWSDGRDG
jgi:hypothetical protein